MDLDHGEEEIEYVFLDDDRERHFCMVFSDKNGGVDGTKPLLHATKRYVYN